VQQKLESVEAELRQLTTAHPQLAEYGLQTLQAELLAVEADTYAELVKVGLLQKELSPLLRQTDAPH
jgi:CPA1 family monovalent cation:H+ antiporter